MSSQTERSGGSAPPQRPMERRTEGCIESVD